MKTIPIRNGLADYLRSPEDPSGIIVSEQRKFIYMKAAKTAGTSILREGFEKMDIGTFHLKDHPDQYNEWINRITDKDLEDYFIFSVIRNPWDRLVSTATYFKIPVKEFVKNIDDYWENDDIKQHSLPCSLYTHLNGEPFVDFVCRFECLQPDMNLVFDHLDLRREKLPFVNRSKHYHYSRYYNDTEKNIIEDKYRNDIKYFGYAFESEVFPKRSVLSMAARFLPGITRRFRARS